MLQVQYIGDSEFEVVGQESFRDRNEMISVPLELIENASATSMRKALADYRHDMWLDDGGYTDVWLSPVSREEFDDDMSEVLAIRLRGRADRLSVAITLGVDPYDDEATARVADVLSPLLARLRASITELEEDYTVPPSSVCEISVPFRRRTIGQLVAAGEQVEALAGAAVSGDLTVETTADLVRSGNGELLLGQSERSWLDAKSAPYVLGSAEQRLSFAKDVAAFANTDLGGVIAIGLRSRSTPDGDVIVRATPFSPELMRPSQLRAVLRGRVYPVPLGVEVKVVGRPDGLAMGLIVVPPQLEERKPFVLRGTNVDGRIRENYVAVPLRVGEDTAFDDIAGIHGLMSAGRAALSGPLRRK